MKRIRKSYRWTMSTLAAACLSWLPAAHAQLGWADLHAHPTAHLGFGHLEPHGLCSAAEGIFHGSPGTFLDLAHPEATFPIDLAACAPETHAACDATTGSIIQKRQRTMLVNRLEDGFMSHTATGWPSFDGWPSAGSRTHQQMHLKWLHRAWQGGMRFMIASITDNELLSKYYHDDHNGPGIFRPERGFDRHSAIRQIAFLRTMDAANDWFTIVHTAAQASDAIARGQLAMVLGVELDNLTLADLTTLIDVHGVRSVIPVHMSDNSIAGAAVHDNLLNTLNVWHTGKFFSVEGDASLKFRLGQPQELTESFIFPLGYAIAPADISLERWQALGYQCFPAMDRSSCVADGEGHHNKLGLVNPGAIVQLMRKGVLLDVAHMSFKAVQETLLLSERLRYPLIDSHTGMREASGGDSERHLTRQQVGRIAKGGGVIGLGTEGDPLPHVLVSSRGEPAMRLTSDAREWRRYPQPDDLARPDDIARRLMVRVATGEDDLRGGDGLACRPSAAQLVLRLADGRTFRRDLNLRHGWASNSVHEVAWDLAGTAGLGPQAVANITGFDLQLVQGSGCAGLDNWDVSSLTIEYGGTNASGRSIAGGVLVERQGAPYRRLTKEVPAFRVTRAISAPRKEALRLATVNKLEFAFQTGGDDLGAVLEVVLKLKNGNEQRKNVRSLDAFSGSFEGGRVANGTWTLTPAVPYGDIESLYLVEHSSSVGVDWDNWDIARLKVVWEGCRPGPCATPTRETLVDREAAEFRGVKSFRVTKDQPSVTLWQGLSDFSAPTQRISVLEAAVHTGQDDLRAGSNARLALRLKDGTERVFPLNRGALLDNGTEKRQRPLFVEPAIEFGNLLSVDLRTDFAGGVEGDNWNVDGFVVSNLDDPLSRWVEGFDKVHAAMSAGGQPAIALGTDLNGLQTQMPFVKAGTGPFGQQLSFLPEPFRLTGGDSTAGRLYTLSMDGIAHVGLLPDFLNSVQSLGNPRTQILFNSARAVVETWRRAEIAGAAIP